MADVRPFQGIRYNHKIVKNVADVICPPYDVISPEAQQELYRRHEYNFIRLEFGRDLPQDVAGDNRYTRAATTLEKWLKEGVLVIERTPAIYLHDHYFRYQGREYRRRGMIARTRLEEWDSLVVRPHEGTMAEAKSDRINLLRTLKANTSPIFALYEDAGQEIASLLKACEQRESLIDVTVDGERHVLRYIATAQDIDTIHRNLASQSLYIADGHHRYESALAYMREVQNNSPDYTQDAACNFTMMTLVDFNDPGLLILPPHRLLRGIARPNLKELRNKLAALFEIEKLPVSQPDTWQKVDALMSQEENRLYLFGLDAENLLVLKAHDHDVVSRMMPLFHSALYKSLDVSMIDHIVMEKLLGLTPSREETRIAYTYDRQDAIHRVLDQEYQLAFLLKPVKSSLIKAIADIGDRLPRKSTYFYPKLPSGLVFYRLV